LNVVQHINVILTLKLFYIFRFAFLFFPKNYR